MPADTRLRPEDPVDVFGFTARVYNRLRAYGAPTVKDLLAWNGNELLDIPNFGPGSLYEVIDVLAKHGLKLRAPAGPLPARPGTRVSEQEIRELVAKELLAVDPAEWALAGQHAGHKAAWIVRGRR